MKAKFFFATLLLAGAAFVANAQGYKDGIDFYKIGKLDDAQELLERNLDGASNKAEALYYLGQVAFDKKDYSLAKSYYDRGVQANPQYPYNYVGQGAVAIENGDAKTAENLFKQAEKLSKKDSQLAIAMAKAYYKKDPNAYAKQIAKLKANALKWNPSDPSYFIFEGDDFGHQKEWGKAAGQYELAFQYVPDNIESRVKFSNVDFFLNPARSIQALEELLTLVPNSALVQRELAEKYYENNNAKKALEYYGKYYDNPNHFAKDEVRYAQLLMMNKDYDKAVEVCNGLIAQNDFSSNKFFGYRLKLYSLCGKEDWEAAANTGAEFFALPENGSTPYLVGDYTNYANALNHTNRSAEAVATFEKAIEQFPADKDLRAQLAAIYNKAQMYDKAAEVRQSIIDAGNYKTSDLYYLANAYVRLAENSQDETAKQDAINKALAAANEAVQKEPEGLDYLYMLGRVQTLSENNSFSGAALPTYTKMLQVLNNNSNVSDAAYYYKTAYRYLATNSIKQGLRDQALDYYKKWYQLEPSNESLRDAITKLESVK